MKTSLWAATLLFTACTTADAEFPCGGKALKTVPGTAVCDGVVDCWGGQDERGDDCATALAYCDQPEPQAILASQVCDGAEDCNDAFDEADCP